MQKILITITPIIFTILHIALYNILTDTVKVNSHVPRWMYAAVILYPPACDYVNAVLLPLELICMIKLSVRV